jgi:rubrerythrin
MGYTDRELSNLTEALNLEYGANRRYAVQIDKLTHPRLIGILEGVKRNEGEHLDTSLKILRENAPKEKVAGWGTILMFLRQNLAFEEIAAKSYGRFAREAEDPELKKTFLELSRSEYGHINLFKTLIEGIESGNFPLISLCPLCGWELHWGKEPKDGEVQRCPKCGGEFELTLENDDYQVKRIK